MEKVGNKKLSSAVYLHLPFCKTKCAYCDFASFAGMEHLMERYVDALTKEIGDYAPLDIKTFYMGGGTPSLLPEKLLAKILHAAKKSFGLKPDVETTIEVNPATASANKLQFFAETGINRLSVGVQSFDDRTLKILGRGYKARECAKILESARKAGFKNLSVDLLCGISGQSEKSFLSDMQKAAEFLPEHFSVYQLTLEKGATRGPKEADEERQAAMYDTAVDFLQSKGYRHYEVSNFAMPEKECRHNMAYWLGEEYLGLGSSAHSFFNSSRFANPDDPVDYINSIRNGKARLQTTTSKKEELMNYLLMKLRLVNEEVSFAELDGKTEGDFLAKYAGVIERLHKNRMAQVGNDGFTLTRRGLLFLNNVLLEFL